MATFSLVEIPVPPRGKKAKRTEAIRIAEEICATIRGTTAWIDITLDCSGDDPSERAVMLHLKKRVASLGFYIRRRRTGVIRIQTVPFPTRNVSEEQRRIAGVRMAAARAALKANRAA